MKRLLWVFVLSSSLAARGDITEGVLAAYLFNGNADDASGRARHGQLVDAGFTADRFGATNSAVWLNGQGAWVSTPVNGQQHPVSISFWFYLDARPGSRLFTVISSSMGDSFGHGYIIGSGTNTLNANLSAQFPFAARRWTHGVVTYGNEVRVYLDGALMASKPLPPGAGTPADRFTVGRHAGSAEGHYFPGAIDDVVLYQRELSAEEVTELFTAGASLEARLLAAERKRQQLAQLADEAADRDGVRAERPDGFSLADGTLPIAVTVNNAQEPGTNAWAVVDGDTNTVWTAADDNTGWWLAAEYENPATFSGAALESTDGHPLDAQWITSMDGQTWSPWDMVKPSSFHWLVGLIPASADLSGPPIVRELRVW